MTDTWQSLGPISAGGTVFDLNSDQNQLWLVTEAGIFRKHTGNGAGWQPLTQSQPLPHLTALVGREKYLIVSSVIGQIAYAMNGGQSWYSGRIAQTADEAITCLTVSPNFTTDTVALAGTNGAGVLRSINAGRSWTLVNAGLWDFEVIALATAPNWERREVCFAATAQGLYRSPCGGRAWKKSDEGLNDAVCLAIAVSSNFAQDQTVFVATETNGIFRSQDGGRTWQACNEGLTYISREAAEAVNCLWLHPDLAQNPICIAGLGDGRLFRSLDGGDNWTCVLESQVPTFSLAEFDGRLYAGVSDQGLFYSTDDGATWQSDETLTALPFTRFVSDGEVNLFAYGPQVGLWRSGDKGQNWDQLSVVARPAGRATRLPEEESLLSFSVSPDATCLLAGTTSTLLKSTDRGQTWQDVQSGLAVTAMGYSANFAQDGHVWVGTEQGQMFASTDSGQTWAAGQAPQLGQPLISIVSVTGGLLASTFDPVEQTVTLWKSGDGGKTWFKGQQEASNRPAIQFLMPQSASQATLVATGNHCWQVGSEGWPVVLETEEPILNLIRLSEGGLTQTKGILALTTSNIFISADEGETWTQDESLVGQSLLDVAVCGQQLVILGVGGSIWRREATF